MSGGEGPMSERVAKRPHLWIPTLWLPVSIQSFLEAPFKIP